MKESKFIAMPGSERVPVPGARAVAAADGEAWLEVTVKLARQAPLPVLDGRPAVALTHAEMGAQYGASPAAIKRVSDTFTGFGLVVLDSNATTRTVKLGGQVSAMEEAFQVKLMKFEQGDTT